MRMSRVLWLVRHGERRDEVEPGWTEQADRPHDPPLTETGRRQAARVGERLRGCDVETIYTSPFLRAAETAHIVAEHLDRTVFVDHGLSEHLNAAWFDVAPSVLTPRALAERFDTVDPLHTSTRRPHYPESAEEAAERTVRAVRRLAKDDPSPTLFVGHGLTVGSVVAGFTGRTDVETPVCGLTKLTEYPWGWEADLLADTSHLGELDVAVDEADEGGETDECGETDEADGADTEQ